MKVEYLIGNHTPNHGEGITVDDLIKLLQQFSPKARGNYLRVVVDDLGNSKDVIGIGVAQHDQMESHEANVYILLQ
jgi:hypothetical protein